MNIAGSRASKAAAFALAAALQVYAGGGFALAAAEAPTGAGVPAARQAAVQGRLVTTGNNPVSVNGNSARTGETIFSGQRITTPAGTQATVELPGLGSLEINPGSDVTLTFGEGRIGVVVLSGCVRLKTERGVTGTVESKGTRRTTDPQKRDEIDTCDDEGGAPPLASVGPAAGGLSSGTATVLTTAIVGTFAIIANQFISDSNNPTPAPCTPIPGTTSPLTPPSGCVP
ncbi:MAG TPA: hypothetical protein VFZ44_04990 [Pyrinomonadaceae bacterium]